MTAAYYSLLVCVSILDIRTRIIKNEFPIIIGILALFQVGIGRMPFLELLAGAILGGFPFFLMAWIYGTDAMGGGDVKFMIANGMMLGSRVLWASGIAMFLSCLYFLIAKIRNKKKKGIPLAPFLSIGCVIIRLLVKE